MSIFDMMHKAFTVVPRASVTAPDRFVADWFRAHLSPASADLLLSLSGPATELWVTSVVLIILATLTFTRRWALLAGFALAVPGGAILGLMTTFIVRRERPFVMGPFGEWGGLSFPSGHALIATLLYGFLLLMLLPRFDRVRWRAALAAAATAMIAGVAFSRVALGAHYLSDVLAAVCFGAAWVAVCWMLTLRWLKPQPLQPLPIQTAEPADQPA